MNDARLLDLRDEVLGQVAHYIGLPIPEVFEEIAPILAQAVVLAKDPRHQTEQEADMATPLLGQYLVAINGFIHARNESSLAEWIALEPPFNSHYQGMIQELNQAYPKGSDAALEQKCSQALRAAVDGDDGSPWTAFVKFMLQYLAYLRDVSADESRYLETYELLSELQQRANSALSHSTLGHLVLPIVVANAKLVCRLAIGLDKQPELIAHLKSAGQAGGEDGGPRETLPERAANILRQAFVTCLNDRASGLSADGKPEGKKRGIYMIANLCLKILFQCRKTRNATQIFENIYNLSPPLSAYPKRERVTYLYYLGRFLFGNSHFYRAQLALQYAYDEAPARPECARQRRHILVYLIASNIILGRFPSDALLNRPEAHGLRERFLPLCFAIQEGNLGAFRQHLAFDGPNADWFLHFRILLQLRNRCEPLVWRSLVRKTWLLNGTRPLPESKVTPQTTLDDLVTAFTWASNHGAPGTNDYTDPDFHGVDYGDTGGDSIDATAVESKLSSLIDQGLLNGFIAHKQAKFAITGVKAKGGDVLAAGFPQPWGVLKGKAERFGEDEVPGWKKQQQGGQGGGAVRPGPGVVMTFGSMKAIGAAG
ncbi:hypothetical protein LTR36_003695 [Oleoguttula mirabilis]|uniref:PCI domain-containing protein n=1 Tax=Oleoguttula mirabilis TaxID=1507867 RepID=A0AAV9JJR1_9PEZI|nr:hypothetical protein LTR36_003695 [Oleoguttula mirabilis]